MMRRLLLVVLCACAHEKGGPVDDGNDPADDGGDDDDDDGGVDSTAIGDSAGGGDNDSFATAESFDSPDAEEVTVDGEIETPGDRDFFVFDATAGHVYRIYAQGGGDEGEPDTVIQVYGPDEVLIGMNDDLPYRMLGTDSGYYVRASVDGPHYIEVLDYADWAGDDPVGNPTFDYTLFVLNFPVWLGANEDSAVDDDTPAQAFDNTEDVDGDGNPEYSWYNIGWGPDLPYAETPGAIDPAGDEDWLWFTVDALDLTYCQFSEFPGLVTAADLTFELYKEDCDPTCDGTGAVRVAATDNPDIGTDYGFLYDAGITYPMAGPAAYYLRILDGSGTGGTDHWYSALYGCYTPELANSEVETGATDVEDGQSLALTQSTTDPTYRYTRFVGFLDGTPIGAPDQTDAYIVDWVDAGDTVDITVETTTQGSLLEDAEIVVWHEDAPGTWTELATSSGAVPTFASLIAPDGNRIAVSITSTSHAQGTDQYYLGLIAAYIP